MSQNSFIVYGKQDCPNCKTTKSILDAKQISYKYKSVPEDLSAKDFSIVMEAFGIFPRSFPQVVKVDGETNVASYVGGLQELVAELKK
jgi:glutaredoxin